MDFALQLNFTPVLDVPKLNILINALKESLGALGQDIKLLDADKIEAELRKTKSGLVGVEQEAKKTEKGLRAVGDPKNIEKLPGLLTRLRSGFADMGKQAVGVFTGGVLTSGVSGIVSGLQQAIDIGSSYQASLADLKSITGSTDDQLDKMSKSARALAKEFGGDAVGQIDSYKTILSRLGPGIGDSPEALEKMGRSVATLSAATGDTAAASVDALTTSLLQFRVSMDDPAAAADVMAEQMNVLAASAQEGAVDVPKVSDALRACGSQAYESNVKFTETVSLLQGLGAGGKEGAEGGTALRNVMAKLNEGRFLPKDTLKELKAAGVDINTLSNKSLSFTDRLRELKKIQNDTALTAKFFGTENAAAGSILLASVDATDELTAKITGTNVAFEQAAVRQETFAAFMARAKAFISDVAISLFDAATAVYQFIAPIAEDLVPLLTTFGPIVAVIVTAFIAYSNATKIAAAAQALFNGVLAANPIGAVLIGVLALLAGIKLLSSALQVTAQDQLENTQAEGELLKAQKDTNLETQKRIKSSLSLGDEYKALAGKTTRTAAEEARLREVSLQLNQQYPGLIANTKDFSVNLSNIEAQAGLSKDKLSQLSGELDALNARIASNAKETAYRVRNVAGQDAESALVDALISNSTGVLDYLSDVGDKLGEAVVGKSEARNVAEQFFAPFKQAVYKAITDDEVNNALLDFQDKINKSAELDDKGKLSVFTAARKFATEQAKILQGDNQKTEEAVTQKVQEESTKRVAVDKKEKKEKEKTAFELAKAKFDIEEGVTKRQAKNLELSQEEKILNEQRQKTLLDEKTLEEQKLQQLKELKAEFQELFRISQDGTIGISLEKDKGEKEVLDAMIDEINQAVLESQNKVKAVQLKIDTEQAEAEAKRLEKLYAERLQALSVQSERETAQIEKTIEKQNGISEKVFAAYTDRQTVSSRERSSVQIKEIESLKERQIITEEQYNAKRYEIEQESSRRELITRSQIEGQRLEIERQSDVQRLELKKIQTMRELEILQRAGKDDEAAVVEARLEDVITALESKSDPLISAGEKIQDGLTDVFVNLGALNVEGAKNSFRSLFAVISGGISRLASAYVLETLFTTIPTTGVLGLLAVPALKSFIEGSINLLIGPILSSLTSFAGSGIATHPMLAVVGDVPGPNKSEAILNSDMMTLALQTAIATYEGRLIGVLQAMRQDIQNFSGRLRVVESDIYGGYNSHATEVSRRGRILPA